MFARSAMRFWVADRHPFLTLPPLSTSGVYTADVLLYDPGVIWLPILDVGATVSWSCETSPFTRTMTLRRGSSSSFSPPGHFPFVAAETNLFQSLRGSQENFRPGRLTLELTIPRHTSVRRDVPVNNFDMAIPGAYPTPYETHDRWMRVFDWPAYTHTGAQVHAFLINSLVESAYYHSTVFLVGSDSPGAPRLPSDARVPKIRGRLPFGSVVWSMPAKAISVTDNMDTFTIQFAATVDRQRKQGGWIIVVPKFIRIPAFDDYEEDALIWDVFFERVEYQMVMEYSI